jgi:voltage-gated potassium channel
MTKKEILYEVSMAFLALLVAVVLFIELNFKLTRVQENTLAYVDYSVLIVFVIDYFYRLLKAKDKWAFFKENIIDLIAIVPFDKAFRIARVLRLTRLLRFSKASRLLRLLRILKLARLAAFLKRPVIILKNILKTNGLIYVIAVTVIVVIIGAIGIMLVEPGIGSFNDALWWSVVTATTVGYGDISPKTTFGRIIAMFLMIVGIGLLGMVTGSIATYFVSKMQKDEKQKTVADEQIEYIKGKLDDIGLLSHSDIQGIIAILYSVWKQKAKEIGTISGATNEGDDKGIEKYH